MCIGISKPCAAIPPYNWPNLLKIFSGIKTIKSIHESFLFEDDLFRYEAGIFRNEARASMGQNSDIKSAGAFFRSQDGSSSGSTA